MREVTRDVAVSVDGEIDCHNEPGLIIHDTGSFNFAITVATKSGDVMFVDRFTPSVHPSPFVAVCVALLAEGGLEAYPFEFVVFADDGPNRSPGTELGTLAVTADIPPLKGGGKDPIWISADISDLDVTVSSGSAYIGVRWLNEAPHAWIGLDDSPVNPPGFAGGYVWAEETGGIWEPMVEVLGSYRAVFVRAVQGLSDCELNPGPVSWLSVVPPSGSTSPGDSSNVQVTIDATGLEPGDYRASLCIENNDPFRSMFAVPVELSVMPAPELVFEPTSHDFGTVDVGETSPPKAATLINNGNAEATELTLDLPAGPFAIDFTDCGANLPAEQSCEVAVTFLPPEAGDAKATLTAASAEGVSALLELSGHGRKEGAGFTPVALEINAKGNRVFDPGEVVDVAPAWRNDDTDAVELSGVVSGFGGPEGAGYSVHQDGAEYGLAEPGETVDCRNGGVCYALSVSESTGRPATHWMASFEETLSQGATHTWSLHIGESFTDVPRTSPFYRSIETLLHHEISGGCGDAAYCPNDGNTRGQMPVHVLRALEGKDYAPSPCAADEQRFTDVPVGSPLCPWIEELADRGVVAGCDAGAYCPNDAVTRAQMAVFLLRTLEGDGYTPEGCEGLFVDVPCASPFAVWVEELARREVTGGCSATEYCPTSPVNRQQMAVFITRVFGLELYGP